MVTKWLKHLGTCFDQDGRLTLTDPDGDLLEVIRAAGFAEPMLALFVRQKEDKGEVSEAAVNLTVEMAEELLEYLWAFVEEAHTP